MKINHGRFIKSKNLVLSSSLLAHPRCLEILNINSVPLRDAFKIGEDIIVDTLLTKIVQQEYIKRKSYILYVSNTEIVIVLITIICNYIFQNVLSMNVIWKGLFLNVNLMDQ